MNEGTDPELSVFEEKQHRVNVWLAAITAASVIVSVASVVVAIAAINSAEYIAKESGSLDKGKIVVRIGNMELSNKGTNRVLMAIPTVTD